MPPTHRPNTTLRKTRVKSISSNWRASTGEAVVCEPGVLVVGLIGGPGAQEEGRVLREAGGYGAETWLIGREADDDRGLAGWISLVGSDLHPWARLPLLVYPAHALALRLALARGCDPDSPRHLGQVVILDSA